MGVGNYPSVITDNALTSLSIFDVVHVAGYLVNNALWRLG